MNIQKKKAFMAMAYAVSGMSHCVRRQVGCVIVLPNGHVAIGYNGTPAGEDNCCEDSVTGETKQNVIHAEVNALDKIPIDEDLTSAYLFSTTCPCMPCAEKVVDRRVGTVIYDEAKNTNSGLAYLLEHGVCVEQLSI